MEPARWPATKYFDFEFLARLYDVNGLEAYRSVEEECQFLPFKTDFQSLHQALHMNYSQRQTSKLEQSWYIGWYAIIVHQINSTDSTEHDLIY